MKLLDRFIKADKKKIKNGTSIEQGFFNWLDEILGKQLPDSIKAINFNIYEDGDDKWSIELVGCSIFDENDSDWACHEVFATRENPYILFEPGDWEAVLNLFSSYLKNYLDSGKYSELLKSYNGVGIGFVDGDLNIVYKKSFLSNKLNCIC